MFSFLVGASSHSGITKRISRSSNALINRATYEIRRIYPISYVKSPTRAQCLHF